MCVCVYVKCVYWLWTDGHLHLPYCYCRTKLFRSVQHSSRTSEHPYSATKSQQKCTASIMGGPSGTCMSVDRKISPQIFSGKKAGYCSDLQLLTLYCRPLRSSAAESLSAPKGEAHQVRCQKKCLSFLEEESLSQEHTEEIQKH